MIQFDPHACYLLNDVTKPRKQKRNCRLAMSQSSTEGNVLCEVSEENADALKVVISRYYIASSYCGNTFKRFATLDVFSSYAVMLF